RKDLEHFDGLFFHDALAVDFAFGRLLQERVFRDALLNRVLILGNFAQQSGHIQGLNAARRIEHSRRESGVVSYSLEFESEFIVAKRVRSENVRLENISFAPVVFKPGDGLAGVILDANEQFCRSTEQISQSSAAARGE